MSTPVRIRANFIRGALTVDLPNAASGDTGTFHGANLDKLPTVTGGAIASLTVDPSGTQGDPEIVWVTAHTSGSTTATILRGQEGTSPRQHLVSNGIEYAHRSTEQDWAQVDLFHSSVAATGPVGSVVHKIEVFDYSGNSLGYVPVYDGIT